MALLLLSFSVPLPFPALGRGLFQPLPHFCLLASPLSSAFVLSPGRRTRERGQAWSSSPAAIHPALILSCSLPCFPTLATALSPFALELPAPQGGCRPCLLPPPPPRPLLQPLLLRWRLARWLGRGEAMEPGHVSWPQAEPLPWPQSHTGQAQLCSPKSLETGARLLPPGAAVDSHVPPGWETEPRS